MIVDLLLDVLVTGLPYVLPFLGVWLLFRLLGEIDLTIDSSLTLGAAVTAVALAGGLPAPVALALAILAGGIAGLATALLHVTLKVPVLMAGFVSWIGLYSVNLRIMGQPTVGLGGSATLYEPLKGLSRTARDLATVGLLGVIVVIALVAMAAFLRTELGLAIRVAGTNPRMARSYGVDQRLAVALGLVLANGLGALGGALVAQGQGFAEVNMGTGTLVASVGAILIGELLVPARASRVGRALVGVCAGGLAYRGVLVGALRAGLPATDLRLVIAATLVAALALQRLVAHRARRGAVPGARATVVARREEASRAPVA